MDKEDAEQRERWRKEDAECDTELRKENAEHREREKKEDDECREIWRKEDAECRKEDAECERVEKRRERADHHQEFLKTVDEWWYGPHVSYPIITHSIPSILVQEVSKLQVFPSFPIINTSVASSPVQKVTSLRVAPKTALKVHFKTLKVPVTELSFPKPNLIISCSIPSVPIQQVSLMKIDFPFKSKEGTVLGQLRDQKLSVSTPVQQVTSL